MLLATECADEDQLRLEVETLRTSLAAESERCAQLGVEVARLHASLHEASLACGSVHQMRVERDLYKQQLDDQLKFKRGPLEARLLEANRVMFEQRLQFRSIVDVLAAQRDWVREWAIQCQENMRLREALERREAGTEVSELRRVLLETQSKCAELVMASRQRDTVLAVHDSNARSLALENQRLTLDNELLKEQAKRMWRKLEMARGRGGEERPPKRANSSHDSPAPVEGGGFGLAAVTASAAAAAAVL
jgi:hypothetical protein